MENSNQEIVEVDLREYIQLIWAEKKIIIWVVLAALSLSFFISMRMARIYDSSTLVMVKEDNGMNNLFNQEMLLGIGKNKKMETYIGIFKSRRILGSVIKELNIRDESGDLISVNKLRDAISISGGEDNLMRITVNYSDPSVARDIANKLVEEFREDNLSINTLELTGAESFIKEQLLKTEAKLAKLENRLSEYKKDNNVILPAEQGKAIVDRVTELERVKAKIQIDLKQSQVALKEVEKKLELENKEIISTKVITSNPLVMNYQERLATLEIELSGLNEVYTPKHPRVIQSDEKRKEIKRRLAETVAEIVSSKTQVINPIYSNLKQQFITTHTNIIVLQSQFNSYEEMIGLVNKELESLPQKELVLTRLTRELKIAEGVYMMLKEKKEELQINKAMKSSDLIVIDEAIVKGVPIKPNIKLNMVIATMLAIFLSIGLILLIDYLDTTIKSEDEVKDIIEVPVLGITPNLYDLKEFSDEKRGEVGV